MIRSTFPFIFSFLGKHPTRILLVMKYSTPTKSRLSFNIENQTNMTFLSYPNIFSPSPFYFHPSIHPYALEKEIAEKQTQANVFEQVES